MITSRRLGRTKAYTLSADRCRASSTLPTAVDDGEMDTWIRAGALCDAIPERVAVVPTDERRDKVVGVVGVVLGGQDVARLVARYPLHALVRY